MHRIHKVVFSILCLACLFAANSSLSHETLTTTVLFDREIVRVLNKHCVMCHAEDGPSFPLETYEQTWLQGRKVRADVIARHMPPWAAVPGYGEFVNDNNLTLRETQFVISWVEGLGPRNSGTVFLNVLDSDAPRPRPVRAQAAFNRWQLGQPDLTRQLAANTIMPGQGNEVRRVVIDSGVNSERRLRALEFRPSDRRVVRAAVFTIQETGQWIGSWTPWFGFVELPTGSAYRLPSGAHIVANIYYRGIPERVVERGTLGLFFTDKPAAYLVSDLKLEAKGEVPARATSQRFHAETRLATDTVALALWPEVERGVKSLEVSVRKPDGSTEVLLFAKDIPQDWPTPYLFKTRRALPKGSALSVTAYYANTAGTAEPGGVRLTISSYLR